MDTGSILLALALLVVVAAIIARPLIERPRDDGAALPEENAALLAQRENVLASIRDLDFDHATGKIADGDYQTQRAALVAQGVTILKRLDALGLNGQHGGESLDDQIETMIASRRKSARSTMSRPAGAPMVEPAGVMCPNCGAAARPGDKFCPNCGASLASTCPNCGAAVMAGDKFCGQCGTKLGERVGAG